jgi:hypothetical protein
MKKRLPAGSLFYLYSNAVGYPQPGKRFLPASFQPLFSFKVYYQKGSSINKNIYVVT